MLALTHHIIVQYAAYLVFRKSKLYNLKWFSKYCVLGDDVVIGDIKVAQKYYTLMTDVFKVKINLSKSILSNSGFGEFAKRITNGSVDISPLSLKEFES
jgi:hypothetical protein